MEDTPDKTAALTEPVRQVKILNGLVDSGDLFGSLRTLRIRHDDQHYELRVTKQGKLILTK